MKHKRKVPVQWLEDGPVTQRSTFDGSNAPGHVTTAGGFVGLYGQFAYLSDMTESSTDPAGLVGVVGTAALATQGPRAQLLAGKLQWRMMRSVGEWTVAIQQAVGYGTLGAILAIPRVRVSMGLCLQKVDPAGNREDDESWYLGPTSFPESATSVDRRIVGQRSSWLWKRQWTLQNFASGNTGAGAAYSLGDTTSCFGGTPPGGTLDSYHEGYSVNSQYASITLGGHFDIKRHVTVPEGYALFWKWHAISVDAATQAANAANFALSFRGDYRTLIARPGRAPKQLAR